MKTPLSKQYTPKLMISYKQGVTHLVRTQYIPKTNIFYLLLHTRTCAY